ncbi:phytoene/squalene synthase family protein [Actinoalloteichus sp. AHMU CJ021]|uniref:Phytoene synthase n=1 Tax=Actinoalloteichus caeruleus DSM 43889 TaxID=1120930 RepID=A0ABT1JDQ0_ACTCY|nr:phytoene/squalene synthase family protein [Actinoalloteichus caeruleus]AUS80909.1 phytoene/squalene synthase family protein [Actinoalloteichus sp. AHMU CJ021]MCP2330344.1 phytoene synthase (EC 2.5.1.32) [Actinoalloteichus caeruleus DSM 43889]
MTRRELVAAGVTDPGLHRAYQRCRELHAAHGRTYYLATRLLEPARRPAVHALYGFARLVDDVVDDLEGMRDQAARAAELSALEADLVTGFRSGRSEHPVLAAVVDVVRRYRIDTSYFRDFMRSMRMDLTVDRYPTRRALSVYVRGSADVIGLQVLPVLGTVVPREEAAPHAAALGTAFQLTNFLRDVGEDLDRGRVYLPEDELAEFGVDRDRLVWCRARGWPDRQVRRALADQVSRTRAVYRFAQPGIAMLDPVSRPCVAAAFTLYGEILDRIEDRDHDVFSGRARVTRRRRLAVGLTGMGRSLLVRVAARAARSAGSGGRSGGPAPSLPPSPEQARVPVRRQGSSRSTGSPTGV